MLLLLAYGALCAWFGWIACTWRYDAIEARQWWAARPHIDGITCPPEAKCSICAPGREAAP